MGGRRTYPWPTLAVLALLAAAPAARAIDVLRLTPAADPTANLTLTAVAVDSWTDGPDEVRVLTGNVWVRQGKTSVHADRAVVWLSAEARKRGQPVPVVVYADTPAKNPVRVEAGGGARWQAEAAVVEFRTPAVGLIGGAEIKESQAGSEFYRQALAAVGRPVPPPARPAAAVPIQFETPGKGEPTDLGPETLPAPGAAGTIIPVPLNQTRRIAIAPRSDRPFNIYPMLAGKEKVAIVTGGIKLRASFTTGSLREVEMAADQVVIWQKGGDVTPALGAMQSPTGADGAGADGIEVYLCGNVVVRFGTSRDAAGPGPAGEARTLRADRVYYDVTNHKAVALRADLEYTRAGLVNTGHVVAEELDQLSNTEFTALEAVLHASRLPSDPGFVLAMSRADIYKAPRGARRTIWGTPFYDRRTGQIAEEEPTMLEASNLTARVRDVPFLYLPTVRTNLNDPLGPFQGITARQDRIFGFQAYLTWDALDLVGLTPLEGERWNLLTDYLSIRGPALGTVYTRTSPTFMGMAAPWQFQLKGYGLNDRGEDQVGGPRTYEFQPPGWRGRLLAQYMQQFTLTEPEDLILQAQFACQSDRNFLDQYFNNEYNFGPNQETFLWARYQTGNAAATVLADAYTGQNWETRSYWTPKVSGYLLGQSLFERLTYHTWGSAGYASMNVFRNPPTEYPPIPGVVTPVGLRPVGIDYAVPPPEREVSAARFDWMQRISAPFELGPVKVVPYGVLDLAYYSDSNREDSQGRVYGGGGLKASVPFSRLYPDVCSELFNLQGLYHKNTFAANYYIAGSNVSWAVLPQLDRLNDDATEDAVRDITPWQRTSAAIGPQAGTALELGSYNKFNPRMYALRRLIDTTPDNLDDIQVVQLDWRQRLQTKRGYPGLEHTVDWLTVDLSASVFPAANRDNFGSQIGFVEGTFQWNAGDRTTVYGNLWFDPFSYGARYWELATQFARDDRTAFYLSYKEVQPLASRLVVASATYVFSPKYSITGVTAYDFGYSSSLSNSLLFTRVGTDLQITVGFTYNTLVRNFGFTINVIPNLFATQSGQASASSLSGAGNSGYTNYQSGPAR